MTITSVHVTSPRPAGPPRRPASGLTDRHPCSGLTSVARTFAHQPRGSPHRWLWFFRFCSPGLWRWQLTGPLRTPWISRWHWRTCQSRPVPARQLFWKSVSKQPKSCKYQLMLIHTWCVRFLECGCARTMHGWEWTNYHCLSFFCVKKYQPRFRQEVCKRRQNWLMRRLVWQGAPKANINTYLFLL